MLKSNKLVSHVFISLGGQDVPKEVNQALQEVVVDQNVHLPDYFTIRLSDRELKLLDEGPFDLTKEVEIEGAKDDGEKYTLIKGQITALQPNFNEGMIAELVVHGYDQSHNLFRETRSVAHINKKDSDLAGEIAQRAGLEDEITITSTVYDHIYQHNQSDLTFLMGRAWRIGFECFVSEGKLCFRKPPSNGSAVTLTWGQDLLDFRPRLTLAEQVDEVVVKGWDVNKQEAIVGRANKGGLYPNIKEPKDGAAWAHAFGPGKLVIVDQPVVSQAEADTLAAARLDEISGAFIEAQGRAFRRPDIKPGRFIKLEALGKRFSGDYLVTNAQHVYTADGLYTNFTVCGSRTGLISEKLGAPQRPERWPGVVPAIVTNTADPKKWGRVKVKYPWMTDKAESGWARVLGVGAGPKAGLFVMPEVGDEVLVTFEQGDFDHPFVLGGLWNGKADIPPETAGAASGKKPLVRTWRSRKGHRFTVYDDAKNKIEIVTAGGHQITLDDAKRKIVVASKGGQRVTMDDSSKEVSVESTGNLKIKAAGNLDIEASGNVNVKGALINLN